MPKMIDSFEQFAPIYDRFREQGAFYETFEVPICQELIDHALMRLPSEVRFLELGIGTGLWTAKLFDLAGRRGKSIEGLGIDSSESMLAVASGRLKGLKIKLLQADCMKLGQSGICWQANLVFAALSVDFIGLETYHRLLQGSLLPGGIAIFWLFDHERYTGSGEFVRKMWEVDGESIILKSHRTRLSELENRFSRPKWNLRVRRHVLPILAGIQRSLITGEIAREKEKEPENDVKINDSV